MRIKDHPELRHVLFHLGLAIECLHKGHPKAAEYELEQIWGLIGWDGNDEAFYRFTERGWSGGQKEEEEMSLGRETRGAGAP